MLSKMLSDVRFTGHNFLQVVSNFEALEPLIGEMQGFCSIITLHGLEAEVKGQIDTCKRFKDHDFL